MERGRDKFQKLEIFINLLVKVCRILPRYIRVKLFESFRMLKGYKGLGVRYVLLKSLAKSCGTNVSIHPNVYIFNVDNLIIGNNVSIHPMCYIECGSVGVRIGNDVSIAHGVSILSTNHRYADNYKPIKEQGIDESQVIISDNVWVGAKATILYGSTLGRGCVVGSNCVVTHDVEENAVVGGIPARILKIRGKG